MLNEQLRGTGHLGHGVHKGKCKETGEYQPPLGILSAPSGLQCSFCEVIFRRNCPKCGFKEGKERRLTVIVSLKKEINVAVD